MFQQAFYPILARQFFKSNFDPQLAEIYLSCMHKTVSSKEVYFKFASFFHAKNSINSIDMDKEKIEAT